MSASESEEADTGGTTALGVDPSTLPNYVRTPAGWYHKSCVPEIEDGSSVDENEVVTRPDGTTYQLPPCAHKHYPTRNLPGSGVRPTVNGWIEYGVRSNDLGYKQFNADWDVPKNPTNGANSLVFFFPGIEPSDGSRILQPVLQWVAGTWQIAAYSCGSNCPFSTPKNTAPGHHIQGWITGSNCDNGVCRYQISIKDSTTGAFTTMGWQAHVRYTHGYVALEAYGINHCNQYPNQGSLTMNTAVWRTDGVFSSASWTGHSDGANPSCGHYVTLNGNSSVTLHWSP